MTAKSWKLTRSRWSMILSPDVKDRRADYLKRASETFKLLRKGNPIPSPITEITYGPISRVPYGPISGGEELLAEMSDPSGVRCLKCNHLAPITQQGIWVDLRVCNWCGQDYNIKFTPSTVFRP